MLIISASTASVTYRWTLEYKVFSSLEKVISDDVIVYGRSQCEHYEALRQVLNRIRERGLTLNFEKCELNLERITFLGAVLSASGVPDPEKVRAVVEH